MKKNNMIVDYILVISVDLDWCRLGLDCFFSVLKYFANEVHIAPHVLTSKVDSEIAPGYLTDQA